MTKAERAPVTLIAIELAGGAEALLDEAPNLARSTIERVTTGANALLDEFSLPARAAVTLERGPGPNPLQLRINGVRQGCDTAHVARAARFVFGAAALVADGRDSIPRSADFGEGWITDGDRAPLLAEVIAHASVALLRRVPDMLVTPSIVDELKGDRALDSEGLRIVVRTLVQMGVSIAPREVILHHVAADQASGVDASDTAEFLLALRRPATVDIEIEPSYAEQLSGLSLTGDPSEHVVPMRSAARERLSLIADGLFNELGVRVPPLRFVGASDLGPRQFRTRIGLRGQTWLGIDHDRVLIDRTVDQARAGGIDASPAFNPANDVECATVSASDSDLAIVAGYSTWDALGYLILALASDLRRSAHCLVNADVVEHELSTLNSGFPSLVSAVMDRFGTSLIARVLRRLLAQQVSIRDLRAVFEAMLGHDVAVVADSASRIILDDRIVVDEAQDHGELQGAPDYELSVRKRLRRYLAHKYAQGGRTITVYLLDPDTAEQPISRAIEERRTFQLDGLRAVLHERLDSLSTSQGQPAILTISPIAAYLRERFAVEFPNCGILSYDELPPSISIDPIARLSV